MIIGAESGLSGNGTRWARRVPVNESINKTFQIRRTLDEIFANKAGRFSTSKPQPRENRLTANTIKA